MELLAELYILLLDLTQVGIVFHEILNFPIKVGEKRVGITICFIIITRALVFLLTSNTAINSNCSLILSGIAILICFQGKYLKKMLLFIPTYMVVSGGDALIYYFIKTVATQMDYKIDDSIQFFGVADLIGLCCVIIIVNAIKRRGGNVFKHTMPTYLYLILSFSIITMTLLACGSFFYSLEDFGNSVNFRIIFGLACITTAIGCYILISSFLSIENYKMREQLSEEHIKHIQNYYQNLVKRDEGIRQFRHDYKKHLGSLKILLDKKKYYEMESYLKEIEITAPVNCIDVGNDLANAIISDFYKISEADNIILRVSGCLPEELYISDYDICTIFSNALENAITATKKIIEKDKVISIHIKQQKNKILLEIKNPVQNKVEIIEGKTQTTKTDKSNHGFGILNMKKSVDKYQGSIVYEWIEDTSQLVMILILRNEPPFTL